MDETGPRIFRYVLPLRIVAIVKIGALKTILYFRE
jgi:hypothetical protein